MKNQTQKEKCEAIMKRDTIPHFTLCNEIVELFEKLKDGKYSLNAEDAVFVSEGYITASIVNRYLKQRENLKNDLKAYYGKKYTFKFAIDKALKYLIVEKVFVKEKVNFFGKNTIYAFCACVGDEA
jgi:hypothetical protein